MTDAPAGILSTILRHMVAQASLPFERLDDVFVSTPSLRDETVVRRRLEEWRKLLSRDGSPETFERYLEWHGLSLADAERAVSPVQLREQAPLPAWAETLGSVLTSIATCDSASEPLAFLPIESPVPFQELFAPFVACYRARLALGLEVDLEWLGENALKQLERSLLFSLARFAAPALYREFDVFRAFVDPLARHFEPEDGNPGDVLYRAFVQEMLRSGLARFLQEHALLARILATVTGLAIESNTEFIQRLAADLPDIERVFANGRPLGNIKGVKSVHSDRHRGGRTVIGVGFESGIRVVYKPKVMGTKAAFNGLLAWFNQQNPPLDLRSLKLLDRGTHGYVEAAAPAVCTDPVQVQRFYQRAGMLLCLVYALEGTDCHLENIVASGEYPVLVDTETLFHHRTKTVPHGESPDHAVAKAVQLLEQSALRTALLPMWQMGKDKSIPFDLSGLSGAETQDLPYHSLQWNWVNQDRMVLTVAQNQMAPNWNVPRLNAERVPLHLNADAVIDGFAQAYGILMRCRSSLLAPSGPLEAFRDKPCRFVFRDTRVYALIQKAATETKNLPDGADYGIRLEYLARAFLLSPGKPVFWDMLAAERRSMSQLDTPFFAARIDSDVLPLDGQAEVRGLLAGPSFDAAVERIQGMDEADLRVQRALIRGTIHCGLAQHYGTDGETESQPPSGGLRPLSREELMECARALAQDLEQRAIPGSDGSLTWIAAQRIPRAERFQWQVLGTSFYDGLTGIAFFWAALAKLDGSDHARALAALQSARNLLMNPGLVRPLNLGASDGLGAFLYALVKIGQFLDEPELVQEARQGARYVTADKIGEDEYLDLMSGAAGGILGLLSVYAAVPDGELVDQARACARHLLAHRHASQAGPRAWQTLDRQLLTGMAHGAAGMAYALARLAQVTGEEEWRSAAEEAIAYEETQFDAALANWRDLRTGFAELPPMVSWCHGAAGIGLGRLGALAVLDTPMVRRDIEVALQTTQSSVERCAEHTDHLCCGRMGQIEFLLSAAQRLNQPERAETARLATAQVIERAEQLGGYNFSAVMGQGIYNPGLFRGAAGVGYEFLRLAHPDQLPSILLWE